MRVESVERERGEFKTVLGVHEAGLPACRSTGNLVLYSGDYCTMNLSSQRLLAARYGGRKAHQGKHCPQIPRRSRQFDATLMSE